MRMELFEEGDTVGLGGLSFLSHFPGLGMFSGVRAKVSSCEGQEIGFFDLFPTLESHWMSSQLSLGF